MTVEEDWRGKHILKLRDYKEPTVIENPDSDELRNVVEPWLTALFQNEHLSLLTGAGISSAVHYMATGTAGAGMGNMKDRKSTRLNSSHVKISYAVFCLKKNKRMQI